VIEMRRAQLKFADRGRRFDWSVIEEAGKAHGFDMAAALRESHRLLLIGARNIIQ
jgi:hypothetical protein